MFIQARVLCFLTTTHCPHMGDKVSDAQMFAHKSRHSSDPTTHTQTTKCVMLGIFVSARI